jgi:predicted alpha/beta hydrolase
MSHARPRGGLAFATLAAPIVSYAISDDPFAPLASVEALAGFYSAARAEVRLLRPGDVGARTIGHFGFFRPRFEPTLWREAALFLAEAARTGSRSSSLPPGGSGRMG